MFLAEAVADVGILLLETGEFGLDGVDAGAFLDAGDGFEGDGRRSPGALFEHLPGGEIAGFGLHSDRFRGHEVLVEALEAVHDDVLRVLEGDHAVGFHEGLEDGGLFGEAGAHFLGLLAQFDDAAVGNVQAAFAVAREIGLDDGVDDLGGQFGVFVFDADVEDVAGLGGGGLDHLGEFLDGVPGFEEIGGLGKDAGLEDGFHDAGGGEQLDVRLHDVVLGEAALVVGIAHGGEVDAAAFEEEAAGGGVAGGAGPGVEDGEDRNEDENAEGDRPALEDDGQIVHQVEFVLGGFGLESGFLVVKRGRVHLCGFLSVGWGGTAPPPAGGTGGTAGQGRRRQGLSL